MAKLQEEGTTSIVKTDRAGRTRYTAEYKAEVVAAFAGSGLSGPEFARQCGVKYPTFAAWVSKARSEESPRGEQSAGAAFLVAEVPSQDGVPEGALEVRLPGGVTAVVSSAEQIRLLAELLGTLA